LTNERLVLPIFRGNLQYISVGNLTTNKKAALFLMDYANQRRLKILAEVEVRDAVEVPELIETLHELIETLQMKSTRRRSSAPLSCTSKHLTGIVHST